MKQCEKKLVFYICILDIYCNATSTFELIKCKDNAYIELVGNLNSCKGTPVDNICGVECFAIGSSMKKDQLAPMDCAPCVSPTQQH